MIKAYFSSISLISYQWIRGGYLKNNLTERTISLFFNISLLNSVQKLCGTGFSQFLLLYVVLGPTLLWESYSWRPPLISPAGSVAVRASGKVLISWEKSENSEMHPQTKSSWRWLPHKIHQYSSICFMCLESIFKLLKCNTPFTRILNVLITSYNKVLPVLVHAKVRIKGLGDLQWWQLVN